MLAALGYIGLVVAVFVETAGIPAPGESALVAASVLAASGRLSIPLVIGGAAAAAIAGDNLGYLLGRRFARPFLARGGRFGEQRRKLLACGERFFARYGARAVFLGRWLPFARMTAAWLAGATRMRWRRFAAFNAVGGIGWAASVGGAAYALGTAGARALLIGGVVGLALTATFAVRHWRACNQATLKPNPSGGAHAC